MNCIFLAAFGVTLFVPPPMIFRFATIQDRSIRGSLGEKQVAAYCRKVTLMWVVFFIVNGSAAAWTVFSGSDALWSIYNGGVSYILMGILFAGEFIVRKRVQRMIPRTIPLSAFKNNSRPGSAIVCFEGEWSDGAYKTWDDFLAGTAALRKAIDATDSASGGSASGGGKWLLHCGDSWHFLLAFTALLQRKKEILLTANISPAYIEEISDGAPFLTDMPVRDIPVRGVDSGGIKNIVYIPSVLDPLEKVRAAKTQLPQDSLPAASSAANNTAGNKAALIEEGPAILADETSIVMYTSGSTGKPKAVRQRLTEFEEDNRFVLSKWGEEFLRRKLCSTVSPHHIYGLLFSILLPFSAGVPFKRERIEFPEELEKLTDTEYMIITVPAFLKRAAEIEKSRDLCLKSPWIFTSGGVLEKETAEKTREVFGFWPVEVYGSTETSGIAWRQSVNGPEWTAFDNADLSKNNDGCLVIRSPYIKDPAGFETADLVEILDNGRFLLKGRADSVVKIEEKRISLPEIENRITQSGLAADVWVTAFEDRRQYLAAAVVFNREGKERFAGLAKYKINKFWREYLLQFFENTVIPKKWRYPETLPLDAQGKKKKDELLLLFRDGEFSPEESSRPEDTPSDSSEPDSATAAVAGEKIIERTENSVAVEFSLPDTSPYFDGHFPGFPILPAVAQLDIILRFARQYLGYGDGGGISEIKRIKFTALVRPFTPLLLRLEKSKKSLSFRMTSSGGVPQNVPGDGREGSAKNPPAAAEILYSSGTLIIGEEA